MTKKLVFDYASTQPLFVLVVLNNGKAFQEAQEFWLVLARPRDHTPGRQLRLTPDQALQCPTGFRPSEPLLKAVAPEQCWLVIVAGPIALIQLTSRAKKSYIRRIRSSRLTNRAE